MLKLNGVLAFCIDEREVFRASDASVITSSKSAGYAVQNPFTGGLFYPPATSSEDFALPQLGSISLPFTESGHSQAGARELNAITGFSDDKFVDPFGGSGTTGHAVLQLNKETDTNRNFILMETGNIENGGGFKFTMLDKQINNQAILQMERNELIDTIIASRIDKYQQKYQNLQILKSDNYHYLIAKNSNQEGFFLIWDGPNQNVNFTKEVYQKVVQEATENNLKPPYHVYARLYLCQVDTQVEPKQTLSITIPISLYQKLQQEVGKGKISQFIKNLVEKELSEEEEKLAQAYKKCYANNPQLLAEVKL
ncbi:16846_t:CDS:2 [Funneliformis geosporum]|nr:16846_t:CDS:2 [Funneliformis geosporum]